ncbi:hypothetical protein FRC03_002676 [Tulasnella sp. 419]|nr:hypothetical protein FRC03_002676 [Tulasnella sp. 419]
MSFLGSSSDRPSSFSAIGVDSTLEQWTSEIRKMQSDLDREAEEETKRLMDEIHASRSERKRRASTRPRRSGSLECDDNDAGEENDEIPQSPKDILDIAERQKNQSDALKKLVGEDHSPVKSTHPNVQTSSIPSSPLRYSPVPSTRFIKEAGDLHSPGRSASSANGHKLVGLGISRPVLASANRNGSPTPPEGHSTPSPTGRVKAEKPNRGPLPSRALFSNEDVPRIPLRPTSLQSPLKPSPTIHTQQPSPASSSNPFNGTSGISPSTSPTKGTRRPISDIPSLARSIQPSSSTVHQHFTFKAHSDLGPAFIRPSFQRDPTPSLTRLQGRGFVAERVKAGAGFGSTSSTSSNAPASDSPPSSVKTRKSNVLDRWPAAVANTNTEPPPKALPVPKPLPKHTWPVEQPSTPRTNEPTTPTTRTPRSSISTPKAFFNSPEKSPSKPEASIQRLPSVERMRPLPGLAKKKASMPDLTKPQNKQTPLEDDDTAEFGAIRIPGLGGKSLPQPLHSKADSSEKIMIPKPLKAPTELALAVIEPVALNAVLSHPTRDRARKPRRVKAIVPALSKSTPLPTRSEIAASPAPKVPSSPVVHHPIITDNATTEETLAELAQPSLTAENKGTPTTSVINLSPSPSSVRTSPLSAVLHSETPPPGSPKHMKEKSNEIVDITSTPPPEVEHALNNALDVSEMWTSTPSLSQPSSPSVGSSSPAVVTPTNSAFKRRPLPGLTSSENQALGSASPPTSNRRSVIEVAQELKDEDEEPQTRSIHVRTPASSWIKQSSSRRASEDDSEVDAQETGESEVEEQATQVEPQPSRNPLPPYHPPVAIVNPYSAPIPRPQKGINPALEAAKAERRRSNMEKYASIILPPLEEEQTPVPTPDGSLIKRETSGTSSNEGVDEEGRLIPVSSSGSGSGSGAGGSAHRRSPSAFDVHRAMMEHRALIDMEISSPTATDSPLLTAGDLTSETGEAEVEKEDEMIRFSFGDGEVPSVIDVEAILASRNPYVPPPDHQTISVEVLSIVGNTSIPITSNPHIFHDVEVRAIIHRIKSKSSGLVTTRVFGWRGRMAQVGATEARKLGELATRFGSNLIPCIQGSESEEFVRILGGVMVTRQGPRELWSAENTSMHCVRELHGCIFIEQVELERRNLCSAYSYVASIIDTIYVFHGKGSTDVERGEAYLYAQSISSNDGANIVQFEEGSEDLMFSMSLGDDDYASADFWRFRKNVLDTSTWLYKVDTGDNPKVQWIQEVAAESIVPTGVYIVQAPMELYVVVGGEARSLRKDILYAMHAALAISHYLAPSLPFEPPVHALVLPSKVPIELRIAHFRYMDEEQLNVGETPEHMNLLSSQEALTQLSTTSWPRAALDDYDLLPLGIAPADVATLTASL